jgi:retron-type reverse transcriptase
MDSGQADHVMMPSGPYMGTAFRKQAYVLDADIAGCFDNINHQQLLKKVDACPSITRIIKSWLKDFYDLNNNYFLIFSRSKSVVI